VLHGNALDLDAKPPADRLHRLFDLRPFHEHSIAVCRTDVIQIDVDGKAGQIKKKQVPFLLTNLALSSYQKRMGLNTGVKPGAELAAAAQTAEDRGMEVELVDRNIRTTLLRVWRKTGLWNKMKVVASLFGSLFEKQELNEEELSKLRESDTLSSMLDEMGKLLPSVKQILVDERDTYMAYHIRNAPGEKVLAVVGAAHLPGITRLLQGDEIDPEVITEISIVPPKTTLSKIIPWLIPGIVVALFIGGFCFGNRDSQNHGLARLQAAKCVKRLYLHDDQRQWHNHDQQRHERIT